MNNQPRKASPLGVLVGAVLIAMLLALSGRAGPTGAVAEPVAALRPAALRSHTIATTPTEITWLDADGHRLIWGPRWAGGIRLFDRLTRRLAKVPVSKLDYCSSLTALLAGKRVLLECAGAGNVSVHANVLTWALDDRRVRRLAGFEIGYDGSDPDDLGNLYGAPLRTASGPGTLVFFGFGQGRPNGLWRVAGRRAIRLPYKPPILASVDAAGRRVATLDWVTAGADSGPAWSPDGREIAWNHAGTIWLMRADGSDQHRLSSEGAADPGSRQRDHDPGSVPRWAPNGTTLSIERDDAIYLIGRDGSYEHRLVAGSEPAWSPDGTRIAFIRGNDVWLIGADGSGERRLTSDALQTTSGPQWSSDGKSLVVDRDRSIYLVDLASGAERNLTPGYAPVWSPDGTRVAFEREDHRIYTIRNDGSGLVRVSEPDREEPSFSDFVPAWSPDGRQIAYTQEWEPYRGYGFWFKTIVIVNADGTGQRTRLFESSALDRPTWSPEGRTILVADRSVRGGIRSLNLAGASGKWLAPAQLSAAVEIRDLRSGKLLRRWQVAKERPFYPDGSVAISGRYAVATVASGPGQVKNGKVVGPGFVLERYDIATGARLGRMRWSWRSGWITSLAGRWGVYRSGSRIRLLDVKTGRTAPLAGAGKRVVGPVITGKRIYWAEDYRKGSRVRELVLR